MEVLFRRLRNESAAVSFYRCSLHGAKIDGKLATLYSAWFNADGGRTAWKQRLCAPCVKETISPLLKAVGENESDLVACPACGSNSSADLDPIYLTLYLPKEEAREFALTTCSSCAAKCRISLQHGAEKLPDRQQQNKRTDELGDGDWLGVVS